MLRTFDIAVVLGGQKRKILSQSQLQSPSASTDVLLVRISPRVPRHGVRIVAVDVKTGLRVLKTEREWRHHNVVAQRKLDRFHCFVV